MEINIPDEMFAKGIFKEELKNYYTKKEVEELLDTLRESIIAEIQTSAKITFGDVVVEDKPKTTAKKKTTKKAESTKETALTIPEAPTNEAGKKNVVSFEPIYTPESITSSGVQVVQSTAIPRRTQPKQNDKYEFLDVNPAIFGNG